MNNRKRIQSRTTAFAAERPAIAIALSLVVLSFCVGSLTILPIPSQNQLAFRALQLVFFAAMGCWQVDGRQSRLMPLIRNGIDGRFTFTILIAVLIFVLLSIFYSFMQNGRILVAAASAASFLLPCLIAEQWQQLNAVPEKRFTPWRMQSIKGSSAINIPGNGSAAGRSEKNSSVNGSIGSNATDAFAKGTPAGSVSVRIRLALHYFDVREPSIVAAQSPETLLGNTFSEAIKQTDDLNTAQKTEYSWEFFRENPRMGSRHYLDPAKTLSENGLRDRNLIVARRVKK